MKVLVDPDSVPTTLEECLDNIKTYLGGEDSEELKHYDHNPFLVEKAGAAEFIKSIWSLSDKETRLVMWFQNEYGVNDGYFLSCLILDCLYHDVKGLPRKDKEFVTSYYEKITKNKKEVKHE